MGEVGVTVGPKVFFNYHAESILGLLTPKCLLVAVLMSLVTTAQAQESTITEAIFDQTVKSTLQLFDRLIAGSDDDIYDSMGEGFEAHTTLAEWKLSQIAERATYGTPNLLRHHLVASFPWMDGFMEVHFSGTTTKGYLICGFAIWGDPESNAPKLIEFEKGFLAPADSQKMEYSEEVERFMQLFCSPALIEFVTGSKQVK